MPECLVAHADCLHLRIKAVPGASRDAIAGRLGDRLKIRVAAPPEDGKANHAIIALLARTLSLPGSRLEIVAGHTAREKTIQLSGITLDAASDKLGL
ncbi:MAG: DUF167 domain-containing protein [Phycisphaerales bacterium]|nr:DUF167 domain-containing protein [Phycisphaerales bacterium]